MITNQQEEKTYHLVDFAVPAGKRMKTKEDENLRKYLDLAKELKKLWNVIEIVDETLRTNIKKLEKKQSEQDITDELKPARPQHF